MPIILQLKKRKKKARVALIISEKMDCKARKVIRDKEGYYITKGSILKDIKNSYCVRGLTTEHQTTESY